MRYMETEKKKDSGEIVWGILLILSGITLLLNNLGIVPWQIWDVLIRFWPVLLIIGGIQILVGNNIAAGLVMFLVALVTFGSIWIKALEAVHSPIIGMWGLDGLPWFDWLKQIKIRY